MEKVLVEQFQTYDRFSVRKDGRHMWYECENKRNTERQNDLVLSQHNAHFDKLHGVTEYEKNWKEPKKPKEVVKKRVAKKEVVKEKVTNLSEKQVREIRKLIAQEGEYSIKLSIIAKRYGVGKKTIENIKSNVSYGWVK